MKFQILICLYVILFASIESRRARKAQTKGNFIGSCSNTVLKGTILTADCKNRNQEIQNARLDLNRCYQNSNGSLNHVRNGNFGNSCDQCELTNLTGWTANLTCQCKNDDGNVGEVTINLNEFIDNRNGHLWCGRF